MLRDGLKAIASIAGPDANFLLSLTGLTPRSYTFSIFSEDSQQRRSAALSFPVALSEGASTRIGGIFLAPSIAVDKIEVKWGDNIAIFGQGAPEAEITVVVSSDEETFVRTKSGISGAYLYNFDTALLKRGEHLARAKAALRGEVSPFSKSIGFKVGTKTVLAPLKIPAHPKRDLNNDGRVNLIDFSIAAYWYKKPLSSALKLLEAAVLNGDGKIDLADFSIMAFDWTG